jgi:hypothetical protein
METSYLAVAVSEDENIVRYVGGRHYDPNTGVINGGAFDRNSKDTDGLSVIRRYVFSTDDMVDQNHIRRVVGSRLKFGKTAVFAELNVGEMLRALDEFNQNISVVEDALEVDGDYLANPAHALIVGLPFAGEAIGSLKSEIAGDKIRTTIQSSFPAII